MPNNTESKPDIIFLSCIMRDLKIKLRPHHFCEMAARKGHTVYWSSLHETHTNVCFTPTNIPRIIEVKLLDPIYTNFTSGKSVDSPRSVNQFSNKLKNDCPVIIVNAPYWATFAFDLRQRTNGIIIYDVLDRFENFKDLEPHSDRLKGMHRLLLTSADAVTYTALDMVDYVGRAANPVHIPNGCDPAIFDIGRRKVSFKPFIGYFGAINFWFDSTVVRYLMNCEKYNVQLAGPLGKPEEQHLWSGPQVRFKNSQYLGIVDYHKLPQIACTWSVGLIPFKDVALTKATDPNKLYEYYALGLPVVAADLNELRNISEEMPKLIRPYLVGPGQTREWVKAIDRAIAEDSEERTTARKEWARANTWESRWDKLIKQVEVK